MQTIYIQPLFAPDERRLTLNLDSLSSFNQYIIKYGYENIPVAFGGWVSNDEYWNKLSTFIKSNFKNIVALTRFEKNYGKSTVVNTLYSKVKQKNIQFNYLLTADSDIQFTNDVPKMIERLEDIANKSPLYTKKPFGLCGLQQLVNGCHYKSIYENQYTFTNIIGNIEKVVYPNIPSGIAGGCLFIGREYWEKFGGYKVYGIYGPDDATLLLGCGQLGYSWQVSDTIGIIHPPETDAEYQKLKLTLAQRMLREGIKTNIDKDIAEMDEFWKNKK